MSLRFHGSDPDTALLLCPSWMWNTFLGVFFCFFLCGLGQVSGSGPLSKFPGRSLLWTQTCCVQTALPDTEQGAVLYPHSHYGTLNKTKHPSQFFKSFYLILMVIIEEICDWDVWQLLYKSSVIVAVCCGRTAPSSCCVKMYSTDRPANITQCLK